jgi:DNA-binding NarL/FixJ family response regulator
VSESDGLVTIRGEQEFVRRAGHLFGAVVHEFVCAGNDLSTWSRGTMRSAVVDQLRAVRHPGFQVRKVFTDRVLADGPSLAHLDDVIRFGARVRISRTELPHEMIMMDRRLVVLAGPREADQRTFTVLSDPGAVSGIRSMFEAVWGGARELAEVRPAAVGVPPLDNQRREILTRLASGATDEAAASELGLSVRTYRRRVAELMDSLGARSRFQAGALARELGW